jgi:hypothetical protein
LLPPDRAIRKESRTALIGLAFGYSSFLISRLLRETEVQPLKIFISYRHKDAADGAARLRDGLKDHFGGHVFLDIDDIPVGGEIHERIKAGVANADVLLVVIGPRWLEVESDKYRRSVDDPEDYPRTEIVTAFECKIPVIPILLNGARVPRADDLPSDLKELASRIGREVRHAYFPSDVARLALELKQLPTKHPALVPKPNVETAPKQTAEIDPLWQWPSLRDPDVWLRMLAGLSAAAIGMAVAWYRFS